MYKSAYFALAFVGVVVSTAAQSADIPLPALKAAPALQAPNWTGFYAGVQAGGGLARRAPDRRYTTPSASTAATTICRAAWPA